MDDISRLLAPSYLTVPSSVCELYWSEGLKSRRCARKDGLSVVGAVGRLGIEDASPFDCSSGA